MPPELITYEWFAEAYHFTEEMTDGLSLDALEWWPLIRAAKRQAEESERASEQRMQEGRAQYIRPGMRR